MNNIHTFLIAVVAFAVGAFLPYLGLNGKFNEMDAKMDDMVEYVNSTNDRIDYINLVNRTEKDSNTIQGYPSSVWNQRLFKLAIAENEKDRRFKSVITTN